MDSRRKKSVLKFDARSTCFVGLLNSPARTKSNFLPFPTGKRSVFHESPRTKDLAQATPTSRSVVRPAKGRTKAMSLVTTQDLPTRSQAEPTAEARKGDDAPSMSDITTLPSPPDLDTVHDRNANGNGRERHDVEAAADTRPPRPPPAAAALNSRTPEEIVDNLRFMFAVGIECSNPVVAGNHRVDQLLVTGHYDLWKKDLKLVKSLGLKYLRYGPPIHRIYKGPGQY